MCISGKRWSTEGITSPCEAMVTARRLGELPKEETAKQSSGPVGARGTGGRPAAFVLSSYGTEERERL